MSRYVIGGDGHLTALLCSAARTGDQRTTVSVPGSGSATVEAYDGLGRLISRFSTARAAGALPVRVIAGGFTIVRR